MYNLCLFFKAYLVYFQKDAVIENSILSTFADEKICRQLTYFQFQFHYSNLVLSQSDANWQFNYPSVVLTTLNFSHGTEHHPVHDIRFEQS